MIRRSNSHHSATSTDHSNRAHRRQFSRTQSNASQVPQQQRHTYRQQQQHRSSNEKMNNIVNQSPNLTRRPPPLERRSLRRTENETLTGQQRSKKP